MAYIRPSGTGYIAEVEKRGIREAKTFPTWNEANAWAASRELEIEEVKGVLPGRGKTLHDAIDRFIKEEAPKRKGGRWEAVRLNRIKKEIPDKRLDKLTADDFTLWRNARLAEVQGPSVRREMNVLRSVFEAARCDWGWVKINPMADVKRPPNNPPRKATLSESDIATMCKALDYSDDLPIILERQKVAVAMLIAVETGMRASELVSCVVSGKVARLTETKNGDEREVPLSARARALFARLDNKLEINLGTLDTEFRSARKRAGLSGFTFHDTRATFCTRCARPPSKVDVLTLARIIGHRDIKSLMIYYRESAEDIADRLG